MLAKEPKAASPLLLATPGFLAQFDSDQAGISAGPGSHTCCLLAVDSEQRSLRPQERVGNNRLKPGPPDLGFLLNDQRVLS